MPSLFLETTSTNPYENLARESSLLENISSGEIILYLWQNAHTVVIGKNQNAWRECRVDDLQRDGGLLARRSSGGGAVYHDIGNLNFSFIMDRELYDLQRQLKMILTAVQSLGISAELQGRNDLAIDGRKFSGNAFRFTRTGALHHGTLLFNSDLDKLGRYLQVSKAKMQAKGVTSVPARVCNLREFAPVTLPRLREALHCAFNEDYGNSRQLYCDDTDTPGMRELAKRYASWEWNFGETPAFDIEFATRFEWGEIALQLALRQGHIDSATVYSDAMDEAFIDEIAPRLVACPFVAGEMAAAIRAVPTHASAQTCAEELAQWLEGLEI